MAASATRAKKEKKKSEQRASPLETLLAPVVALVVVASAALRSRRCEPEPREPATSEGAPVGKPTGQSGDERGPNGAAGGHEPPPGRLKAKLDALGQRLPLFGAALAVQRRYGEMRGNNVAAAVTLQSFLALFPLILVIVAVVGFVAAGSTDVAGRIVSSLGLSGEAAQMVQQAVATAERSRKAASIIGLGGLLWSGLGLVNALQFALNQVWQVEERGVKDKAIGLAWLVGSAVLLVAGAAVTTAVGWLPGVVSPLGVIVALGLNFCLWLWTLKVLPNRDIPWRDLVPGAVLGAVGLEALKIVGGYYVPRAVSSSSELYGSLGVVFAILAWLLLFGRLIVYAATLNVVIWERKHGTMTTTIEVPATPGAKLDEVTRSGRMENEDLPGQGEVETTAA